MRNQRILLFRSQAAAFALILLLISAACGSAPPTAEQPRAPTASYATVSPPTTIPSRVASPTTRTGSPTSVLSPTKVPTAVPSPTGTSGTSNGQGTGGGSTNGGSATQNFSAQNSSSTTPDDILKEIAFGGLGGGPGAACGKGPYKSLQVDLDNSTDVADWLSGFYVTTCGWRDGEQVKVTVQSPNGRISTKSEKVYFDPSSGVNEADFGYNLSVDDPPGIYMVIFTGKSGTIEQDVDVSASRGPRMYDLPSLSEYYLYGFVSGEKIRFFWYDTPASMGKLSLTAWNEYTADNNGSVVIHIDSRQGTYTAVGEISGAPLNVPKVLTTRGGPQACADTVPPRLEIGGYAYVSNDPPLDSRVRQGPGTDQTIIGFIAAGHSMQVLEGPQCVGGFIWWRVQATRNTAVIGWSAEGDDSSYFIIPCVSGGTCP